MNVIKTLEFCQSTTTFIYWQQLSPPVEPIPKTLIAVCTIEPKGASPQKTKTTLKFPPKITKKNLEALLPPPDVPAQPVKGGALLGHGALDLFGGICDHTGLDESWVRLIKIKALKYILTF